MLYIATVHFRSPRWIPIQTRELQRHMGVPYCLWASLEGIESGFEECFDRIVVREGDRPEGLRNGVDHASKLNSLAAEICLEASQGDLIMFLDGDAFPVADPWPLIDSSLAKAPLLAVRRAENCDSPNPHPCFCVTRVGTWRDLPGDWSMGPTWPGPNGGPVTDVGANLWRRLELSGTPWVQVLRSNRRNPHPLMLGVYGDAIYHHGMGFRLPFARIDAAEVDADPGPRRKAMRERMESNRALSEAMFHRIQRDDSDWLKELIAV